MAVSQTDVDNLKAAIVSGVLTVEYGGRRITYRSMAELKSALGFAQQDLAAQGGGPDPSVSFGTFSTDERPSPTGLDIWVPGSGWC